VNFDAPRLYHLYYGDGRGTPGSVLTYFPNTKLPRGVSGHGEVGETIFAVPQGSLAFWQDRLTRHGVADVARDHCFGEERLVFGGPDGERFALVERAAEGRRPWGGEEIAETNGILGLDDARLRVSDIGPAAELLEFMGYQRGADDGALTRFVRAGGNPASCVTVQVVRDAPQAKQGAGSVHHIAFAVENLSALERVRRALQGIGQEVSGVKDRDYFQSIYFRTSFGILFEIATNEPGFTRDEPLERLGEALQVPEQHRAKRADIEKTLPSLEG
jgi:glyoxalase family protein